MNKVLIFIGMMMTREESERLTRSIENHLGDDFFVMIYKRSDPKIEVFYSKDLVHINANELIESIKKLAAE
jgi:hypothetical protein